MPPSFQPRYGLDRTCDKKQSTLTCCTCTTDQSLSGWNIKI